MYFCFPQILLHLKKNSIPLSHKRGLRAEKKAEKKVYLHLVTNSQPTDHKSDMHANH